MFVPNRRDGTKPGWGRHHSNLDIIVGAETTRAGDYRNRHSAMRLEQIPNAITAMQLYTMGPRYRNIIEVSTELIN